MLNLYKVGFMTAGHTINLPMMSHDDVKIIEARAMSNLRGLKVMSEPQNYIRFHILMA